MRVTQLLALSGFMLASNVAVAAKLDRDDVPDNCWRVCGPVVGIANKCDGMHDDDDRAEINCICDWNQGATLVPLCEGCIAEYRSTNGSVPDRDDRDDRDDDDDRDDRDDRDDDRREPHDNDAYDILTSCSWSTTSYNPAAATSALSSTGTSPSTADATSTGTSSGSGSDASTTTGSGSNAETTDNAAPGSAAPKAATLAAVMGLGFLAWL